MAVLSLPRRVTHFLWLALLLVVSFYFLSRSSDGWTTMPQTKGWSNPFTTDTGLLSFMGSPQEPLRIAIMESIGTHDEVTAALVHAFGGQKNAELSLFLERPRYHMGDIIGNFTLESPIVSLNNSHGLRRAVREDKPPHIFVSTTCELDLEVDRVVTPLRTLLANATTHLFCVMHHADRWDRGPNVNFVREWVDQDRVDFIGLSHHTLDFLVNKTIPQWKSNATITTRMLPPVFPVDVPEFDSKAEGGLSLAMQGDYSSGRRDYKRIFGHLDGVLRKMNGTTGGEGTEEVSLHLIGHGDRPTVPEDIMDHVVFDQSLSYPDFYALLSRAFALLPAFADDTYFDRKASSTVPAALIAGAPLVASEKLFAAYDYLPRDAAWASNPDEGEMATIERVIGDRAEYIRKRDLMKSTCKELAKENRVNVKEWIAEALAKVAAKADAKP
ncbi:hypothetical protein G7046_g5596 [Stylonectria norvegica]|nr:hypothetical protein G7046_g5596 [Stylonectria norvegica]